MCHSESRNCHAELVSASVRDRPGSESLQGRLVSASKKPILNQVQDQRP
ncbi:MAG: hypothetical protein AB1610_03825 [Nitrospirota bacterium]